MMLADLTDPEVALLYQGSDPETREGWNIIQMNRFHGLIDKMELANLQGDVVYDYVERRMARITADELITKAANNG